MTWCVLQLQMIYSHNTVVLDHEMKNHQIFSSRRNQFTMQTQGNLYKAHSEKRLNKTIVWLLDYKTSLGKKVLFQ